MTTGLSAEEVRDQVLEQFRQNIVKMGRLYVASGVKVPVIEKQLEKTWAVYRKSFDSLSMSMERIFLASCLLEGWRSSTEVAAEKDPNFIRNEEPSNPQFTRGSQTSDGIYIYQNKEPVVLVLGPVLGDSDARKIARIVTEALNREFDK